VDLRPAAGVRREFRNAYLRTSWPGQRPATMRLSNE
jgi:hypothetical protein